MATRRNILVWVHAFSLVVLLVGGVLAWRDARWVVEAAHDRLAEVDRLRLQALNLDRIRYLNEKQGTDEDDPIFLRLSEQLRNLATLSESPTTIRLIGFGPDRRVTFRIEALAPDIQTPSPGPNELGQAINLSAPVLLCPLTSTDTSYSRHISPVRHPRSGQIMAVLMVDFDRNHHGWMMVRAGLPATLATIMLIIAIHIAGRAIRQRACDKTQARTGRVQAERWLAFIMLTALTGYLAGLVYLDQQGKRDKTFHTLANLKAEAIKGAFISMRDLNLESLARFYEASDEVTRTEFNRYTDYLNRLFEFESWAWVQPVTDEERDNFETCMRRDFDEDYMIWEAGPNGKPVPAERRPLYYPVVFVSPEIRHGAAGFDSWSNTRRQEAMRVAMETGITTASDPITVASTGQRAINLYRPVYQEGTLRGFAVAAVDMNHTLDLFQQGYAVENKPVAVDVYEVKTGKPLQLLGSTEPDVDPSLASTRAQLIQPLFFGGKTLAFHYREGPGFSGPSPLMAAMITGGTGLVFAAIGSLIVGQFFGRREWLERLVKERTASLTESLERFDAVASLSQEIIWEIDVEGRYTYVSPIITDILGYTPDEVIGKLFYYDLIPLARRDEIRASTADFMRRGLFIRDYENPVLAKSGAVTWMLTNAAPIRNESGTITGYRGSDQDITARRQSEEQQDLLRRQLQQAQKMEAIGQLAGGLAHDFNNVLTVIMNCVEFLGEDLPPESPAAAEVEEIRSAAGRATDLTHQLLAFSRQQVMTPRVTTANAIVEHLQKMLLRVLPDTISLKLNLSPVPVPIKVDTTQLDQVILNLIINARDAIAGEGIITIRTGTGRIPTEEAARLVDPAPVADAPLAIISITDTGGGIPPGIMDRIFDPFFSTKAPGKGTGLGLPMVFGIIRQHQGNLAVDSVVGRGTTFTLYLPLTAEPVTHAPVPAKKNRPGGDETILLAEDDASVRFGVCRLLRRIGYTVLDAENGEAAIEIARTFNGTIHLLITDLQMPGIDGYETARQFVALRAGAVVLFSSGYAEPDEGSPDLFPGEKRFVRKPYNIDDLARVIRDALNEKKTG